MKQIDKIKLFKIALTASDYETVAEFAATVGDSGVSREAIYQVLAGKWKSEKISQAIDRFITQQLAKLKIQLEQAA